MLAFSVSIITWLLRQREQPTLGAYELVDRTVGRFWIDTMGGGKKYHGADFRLNFHHANNAAQVMNARGASRWMHHMRETILATDFRCRPSHVAAMLTGRACSEHHLQIKS